MKVKKTMRAVCGFAAVILAVLVLLMGAFKYVVSYKVSYKITDIDGAVSPDGTYKIVFQAVGEPDWPFGYSHARLVLKCGGKTVVNYKFDVANDGGVLRSDNWSVSWEENCVNVIISGEEQPDKLYSLSFDGTVRVGSSEGL